MPVDDDVDKLREGDVAALLLAGHRVVALLEVVPDVRGKEESPVIGYAFFAFSDIESLGLFGRFAGSSRL